MKKKVARGRRRRIKPTRIVILIFFVIANTFAWFIYATRVDNDISVHVRSWNVIFEAGDNQITNNVNLNVDSIYPGMTDYLYEINAYNRSEVSATLTYQLLEATIFGDQYITTTGRIERGEAPVVTDLTSAQLENKLANDYPFSIFLDISDTIIDQGTGQETYSFNVVWPYEQNDDETDTYWGMRAAYFKESNPLDSCISIKVKLVITQNLS